MEEDLNDEVDDEVTEKENEGNNEENAEDVKNSKRGLFSRKRKEKGKK